MKKTIEEQKVTQLSLPKSNATSGSSQSGLGQLTQGLGAAKSLYGMGSDVASGLGSLGTGFSSAANAGALDSALGPGFFASNIGLGAEGASAAAPGVMGSIGSFFGSLGPAAMFVKDGGAITRQAHAAGDRVLPIDQNVVEASPGLVPADGTIDQPTGIPAEAKGLVVDQKPVAPSLESDSTMGLIAKHEGFRPTPYWDVNHLRTGFGSDTVTLPDGTVKPVDENTRVTVEDAKRDLARRKMESQGQIRAAVGDDAWNKLDPSAQDALTSTTYNYGRLPGTVAQAVQSGNKSDIATAVNNLGYHNEGVNAGRRAQEAAMIDPDGKYAPVTGKAKTSMGAAASQIVGPGAPSSTSSDGSGLIDKATSSSFLVPALGFLGSMLASQRPTLGGALGEGLLGGTGAYMAQQNQQAAMAKNVLDIVKDRFVVTADPKTGQTIYFNKSTGQTVSPNQYMQAVGGIADSLKVPRGVLGIPTPGTEIPPVASPVTQPGEFSRPGVSGTAAPQQNRQPLPQSDSAQIAQQTSNLGVSDDVRNMSPTQLMEYAKQNKNQFGLVGNRDPDAMQAQIDQYRAIASTLRMQGKDTEAAQQDKNALDSQTRMDTYLRDAVKTQEAKNQEINKANVQGSSTYMDGVTARIQNYDTQRRALTRLAQIYSDNSMGRLTDLKATLGDWSRQFGISLGDNFNAAPNDEALKIATSQAIDGVGDSQLGRAPKAGITAKMLTVPKPEMAPAAAYALIGRTLGEMDYAYARDQAFANKGIGTEVPKFLNEWTSTTKPDPFIKNAFQEIPVARGTDPKYLEGLMKSYGFVPNYGEKSDTARSAAPAQNQTPAAAQRPDASAAAQWAKDHPNDPKSAIILQRLGVR